MYFKGGVMNDTFSLKVEQNKTTVRLLPVLDMSVSEEFLKVMKDSLSLQVNLVLDGEDVERISTSCVQVMLATATALEKSDGTFTITNMSPDFERALQDLGFSEYIMNWSKT